MRRLQWTREGGEWIARTSRFVGGKYRITTRLQPDGSGDVVYNVERLAPAGSGHFRTSFVGAGATLGAGRRSPVLTMSGYERRIAGLREWL
jgi:hypothetical protein